jgi:molybdenum cofactor cytidylyltransferase
MHLRTDTVANCSRACHTVCMKPKPAVILLADEQSVNRLALHGAALDNYHPVSTLIRRVQDTGLSLLLVAPMSMVETASQWLPADQIMPVSSPSVVMQRSDWLVRGVALGVMTCANAGGWIMLPSDMPMVQGSTLLELANAMQYSPVAYPCHRHQRGHPVAFAPELCSELVKLDCEHDLRRLVARYPAADVPVDDPGILMSLNAQSSLDQWRAQLGTYASSQQLAFALPADPMF